MPVFHLSPSSIWLTFISVLTEVAVSQTKFLHHYFLPATACVFWGMWTSSKKVLGQWDTFICFDIRVQVIGSSVLDLQDKQWHIGVTDIDFRRTLTRGLELWQYAWCHECVHEWPGYGMWQRQVGHRAETQIPDMETTILAKFCKHEIKKNLSNLTQISNTVHICSYWLLCTTTVLLCPPLHMNQVFAWCMLEHTIHAF